VNNPEVNDACDNLVPDTEICLGESGMDCTKVYTVVAGDTCEWIQEMYGMTEDVLYGNNPQINAECTNIYIGEVLCVDTEKFDYPPYNLTAYEVSWRSLHIPPSAITNAFPGGRPDLPLLVRRALSDPA